MATIDAMRMVVLNPDEERLQRAAVRFDRKYGKRRLDGMALVLALGTAYGATPVGKQGSDSAEPAS